MRRSPIAALVLGSVAIGFGCSRPPSGEAQASGRGPADASAVEANGAAAPAATKAPPGATVCTSAGGPTCFRFAAPEDALRWVLESDPLILGVGEAHAQRGSEAVASSTKRFTEAFLPILAPRSSDVVVGFSRERIAYIFKDLARVLAP